MKIFRAKYDNVPESPIRTLYGRKGNLLLVLLDVCILQLVGGTEEFRPPPEVAQLIAAPIQEQNDGRLGLIAQYEWLPRMVENRRVLSRDTPANPVVTVQLAPSANVKGVPDLRVLASQVKVGDNVFLSDIDVGAVAVAVAITNAEDNVLAPKIRSELKSKAYNGQPRARRSIESTECLPRVEGVIVILSHWCEYPDLTHRVRAYSVEFEHHVDRTLHGSVVRLMTGELVGMLIATQNQPDGTCRALVYPA